MLSLRPCSAICLGVAGGLMLDRYPMISAADDLVLCLAGIFALGAILATLSRRP